MNFTTDRIPSLTFTYSLSDRGTAGDGLRPERSNSQPDLPRDRLLYQEKYPLPFITTREHPLCYAIFAVADGADPCATLTTLPPAPRREHSCRGNQQQRVYPSKKPLPSPPSILCFVSFALRCAED